MDNLGTMHTYYIHKYIVTCGEKLSRIILIAMYVAKIYLSLMSFVRKEHQN